MYKLFVSILIALVLVGCQMIEAEQQVEKSELNVDVKERLQGKVIDVVDGDTMKVIVNGKEETVRLLLVDTPETVHPSKPVQPFGPEASNYAKEMLTNKDVELELDVRERDKYGRLLVYLYINGQMFNEMLLENGLARLAYVFPPNTKYVDRFLGIEKKAKQEEIGIWSIENYVGEEGFNLKQQQIEDQHCLIKGNINSDGEKIYHPPSSPWYEQTKEEERFCSEKEAKEAGYRKAIY